MKTETNILKAIYNFSDVEFNDFSKLQTKNENRIQARGELLEHYVRYLFCLGDESLFSYGGNANNPPDLIIKNGDAIEIKKINNLNNEIALNSSYPKSKLFPNTFLNKHCDDSNWFSKDMVYIIGSVIKNKLESLWLVAGDCYAADKEVYDKIKLKIKHGVEEVDGVEFTETKELGRVNKVDPLGITNLRIRGMWHIKHPAKVFDYINGKDNILNCIMSKEKYDSMPIDDRNKIENTSNIFIDDIEIRSPNNKVKYIKCKHIYIKGLS